MIPPNGACDWTSDITVASALGERYPEPAALEDAATPT